MRISISTLLASLAHLLSVIVLFDLTRRTWITVSPPQQKATSTNTNTSTNAQIAFVAALLHILSPAGIFLIAPYNESLFSLLSFVGYWLHAQAILERNDGKLIGSGVVFGVSCFARSNGIFNGVLFLWEAIVVGLRIVRGQEFRKSIVHLVFTCIGGVCVGFGFLWIQYLGWVQYCNVDNPREWCLRSVPMIYTFVQDNYWYVYSVLFHPPLYCPPCIAIAD